MALAMVAAIAIPFAAIGGVSATSGLFAPYQSIALGTDTQAVAIGDVTGDGRADVVATGSQGFADYRIYVLAGRPDGTLAAPTSYVTAGSGTHPLQSVAVGDITDDGRADVIVAASSLGIQVFPQLADGTLGQPALIDTVDSLKVRTGEFDGQPGLDLASIGWGTGTLSVFLNDGLGHLGAPLVYAVKHDGYDDLEVGDVVRDGRDDIVVMSGQGYATPNVSVVPQLAGGGFGTPVEYRVGDQVNSNGIGIGDVTGDGRADVIAAYGGNSPTGRLAVFAQTSGGGLAAPVNYASYDIPTPVEVADLDRDGWADVVTLHSGWAKAGIYRAIGDGSLALEELDALPGNSSYDPHGLAVGDITGDGWPDLVIAAPMTGVVILRNLHPSQPSPSPSASDSGSPSPSQAPTPTPAPTQTPKPTPSPTPPPQLPSAPTNLTTSPNLPSGVGLGWAAPASSGTGSVTGYRIYRGPFVNFQTPLVTVGNVLSFIDTTAEAGTTAFYSVAALNAYGEGPRSTAVAAQRAFPPSAPLSLTASVGKGISLSWTAPSNGGSPITAYRIYQGTSSGGETFLVSVGPGTTSYTDAAVVKKSRYFYRVTAVNVIGEGPPSAEANATAR
jgi:hypothetical protein